MATTAGSGSKTGDSAPANKLKSIQKALHDALHTPSAATPIFELIEKNVKLKREYLFMGESSRLHTYTATSSLLCAHSNLCTNLAAFVYRAVHGLGVSC